MTLFEAGILTKMTTDEYKKLPEASRRSEKVTESENKESSESGENGAMSQVCQLISNKQCIHAELY